jgi:hypothetical protein
VPFVNLDTGKVEHMVPKSKRLRLRRDEVRLGLTKGLNIQVRFRPCRQNNVHSRSRC